MAMATLLLRHLLEHLRGVRVTRGEVFGEAHVNAAVLFLGRDRNGQHLAFGQIGEILHGAPSLQLRMILNCYRRPGFAGQFVQRLARAFLRNSSSSRLTSAGCSCCTQWPAPSTRWQ